MNKFLTRALAASAAATAGLLLASCATASPDTPSDPDALIPVKVVVAPILTEPLYYGIDSGIFERHGLEVSLVPGGFLPAQQVPVLLSGEGNISMVGAVTLFAGYLEGLPIQAIHPMLNASDSLEPDSGFIVAPGSGLEGWGDLNGTTLAGPGSGELGELAIKYAIDQAGGDSSTVEFVEMPITNINDAVKSGQVDGALQISSFYSQALAEGLVSFGDPANQYFSGAPTIQLMSTNDWIAENEETLNAFNVAIDEIFEYLNANPEEIREIQRKYTELPDFVIDTAILPTYVTEYNRAGYERALKLAAEYGFLSEELAFDDVVWSGAPVD